jgi:hypothetical protein
MTSRLAPVRPPTDPCSPPVDRRRRRSDVPEEALTRYLQDLAERCGALAVVVGDAAGPLAGSSPAGRDLAAVSAAGVAAVTARWFGPTDDDGIGEAADEDDLYAHDFHEHGHTFVLTSLGVRVPRVREVREAVARILR